MDTKAQIIKKKKIEFIKIKNIFSLKTTVKIKNKPQTERIHSQNISGKRLVFTCIKNI